MYINSISKISRLKIGKPIISFLIHDEEGLLKLFFNYLQIIKAKIVKFIISKPLGICELL